MKTSKRVVVISDLHCGHRSGMTPPEWQIHSKNEIDMKWQKLQAEQWGWYAKTAKSLGPVHLLLVMGDVVDGTSERAEGRDAMRLKKREQTQMGIQCIDIWKASNIEMVYGTRYHVRDWEDDIASSCNANIGAHTFPEVNGTTFDIKHKVGGSQASEHTRYTAIGKADTWNSFWAEAGRQPKGDVILRGHVHYHRAIKRVIGERSVWGMTCPALQGPGTEFGAEQCEGTVDFGLLVFDVAEDGSFTWNDHLAVLKSHAATTTQY